MLQTRTATPVTRTPPLVIHCPAPATASVAMIDPLPDVGAILFKHPIIALAGAASATMNGVVWLLAVDASLLIALGVALISGLFGIIAPILAFRQARHKEDSDRETNLFEKGVEAGREARREEIITLRKNLAEEKAARRAAETRAIELEKENSRLLREK